MDIFEKLEVKLTESKATRYEPVAFSFGDESGRFYYGNRDPLLESWERTMFGDVVNIQACTKQIPESVECYQAYFTTERPLISLGGLSVFGLVNQPYDMGSVLEAKLIVSKIGLPGDELLDVPPVLSMYSKPSGAFAADSPLFYDPDDSTAWREDVTCAMTAIEVKLIEII